MTKYVSKDGKHTTTTTNPSERVDLLNQGYREQKARTQAVKQASSTAQGGSDKSSK